LDTICHLIGAVADQALTIFVFANSPIPSEFVGKMRRRAGDTPIRILTEGRNVGLGSAYNQLFRVASGLGADYLLLFDQDSRPTAGIVGQLEAAAAFLAGTGKNPAVIGPRLMTEGAQPFRLPWRKGVPHEDNDLAAADFVISSGSLILLEAARIVGPFREDFFIDAIDIEWCLRAWFKGRTVWVARSTEMIHRLGHGVIALPFGLTMVDQPPRRFYTYVRNQLVMLRLKHVPISFKVATVLSLPLRALTYLFRYRFSLAVRRAILRGFIHGTMNRLGSPEDVWTYIDRREGAD
jgi:rhamnosyltransferase